jgi:hypothetical protein
VPAVVGSYDRGDDLANAIGVGLAVGIERLMLLVSRWRTGHHG